MNNLIILSKMLLLVNFIKYTFIINLCLNVCLKD